MGTSRRYADAVDRQAAERILQRVAASGPLQSLTEAELDLAHKTLTRDPKPKPARAWVRFGSTPVRVEVEVCQWTEDAIWLRFRAGEKEHYTWVWASAVSPATSPQQPVASGQG